MGLLEKSYRLKSICRLSNFKKFTYNLAQNRLRKGSNLLVDYFPMGYKQHGWNTLHPEMHRQLRILIGVHFGDHQVTYKSITYVLMVEMQASREED